MTDLNRTDSTNLDAIKSDGTVVSANRIGALTTLGCTLASATTYYFPFGSSRASVPVEVATVTFQLRWDATAVLVATVETTVFAMHMNPGDPRGALVLTDYDTTAGYWLPQNPSTAYIPAVGGSAANMTVTVAGGTAGGCEFDLGNLGARRGRIKVVVTTGGVVRGGVHGKSAA